MGERSDCPAIRQALIERCPAFPLSTSTALFERVPIEAQSIDAPLSQAAIFLAVADDHDRLARRHLQRRTGRQHGRGSGSVWLVPVLFTAHRMARMARDACSGSHGPTSHHAGRASFFSMSTARLSGPNSRERGLSGPGSEWKSRPQRRDKRSQIAPECRLVRGYPIACCNRFRRHPARHSWLKGIDLEWPRPRETIAAN